jgi:hypothetical protein
MSGGALDTATDQSRRSFLQAASGAALAACTARFVRGAEPVNALTDGSSRHGPDGAVLLAQIKDAEIQAGFRAALDANLIPAARQVYYPGHFTVTADGVGYGADSTWPGLDSWQMAGAYLRMGRTQIAVDYFDFVRASQRANGHVPFAILPGAQKSDGAWLRGLRHPKDVYSYTPPIRGGLPASSQEPRQWIGLFSHWQPKADPLRALGSVSHILTAGEIHDFAGSQGWLTENLPSVELAANFLLRLRSDNGLIGGSGFYTELPPRNGFDGVTQCYVVHALGELSRLFQAEKNNAVAAKWSDEANALAERFREVFWQGDHFAEYVHAERGLVDAHGLSDVNFAAIAFGVATERQAVKLWPLLTSEPAFWAGGIPTQSVSKPDSYQEWEHHEQLPFGAPPLKDVAAMGRVWYLEMLAARRMADSSRIVKATRLVCRAADENGYWRERYHAQSDGNAAPIGAEKYCEYPAVLARTIFDSAALFC